ncbi:MAG: hypothetical protein IJ111_10485 [Eggerthellaceae bacterium]|nr:hypothetical protein [Eggerthellaceae bacterium]
MPEKIVEPRTPFKRLIDATHQALKKSGTDDEQVLSQKLLDLWFTNIDYYQTRFYGGLLECLEPSAGNDVAGACSEALCIVVQSATMRIGNDECKTLREKFETLWAIPRSFEVNSKRSEEHFSMYLPEQRDVMTSLEMLRESFRPYIKHADYEALVSEIGDEIAFYDELRSEYCDKPAVAFRQLLPIWITKEASPLYDLSIWADEKSIGSVCDAVCKGFMDHKSEFGAFDIESAACKQFTDEILSLTRKLASSQGVDSNPYADTRVREMYAALYGNGDDPTYEHFPSDFPEEITIKAKLVWNLVGCALEGPWSVVSWMNVRTDPVHDAERPAAELDRTLEAGCGRAIFRQLMAWDKDSYASSRLAFEVELGSDDFETATPDEGLVAVIGRAFAPGYAPALQFAEADKPKLFRMASAIGSNRPNSYFATDFIKDSAWHLGVFLEGEPRRAYLVDLGSLNGTYVIREGERGRKLAFAFPGRNRNRSIADVLAPMIEHGISEEDVSIVGYLAAKRGDIIILGDSQFEIL